VSYSSPPQNVQRPEKGHKNDVRAASSVETLEIAERLPYALFNARFNVECYGFKEHSLILLSSGLTKQ